MLLKCVEALSSPKCTACTVSVPVQSLISTSPNEDKCIFKKVGHIHPIVSKRCLGFPTTQQLDFSRIARSVLIHWQLEKSAMQQCLQYQRSVPSLARMQVGTQAQSQKRERERERKACAGEILDAGMVGFPPLLPRTLADVRHR